MPQLDGVRGLAIALVLVSHFGVLDTWQATRLPGRFLGAIGVDLFFVLSGFLITGILLQAHARTRRPLAGAAGEARGALAPAALRAELARFYARRALRIFPVYYLTLAVLFAAGAPHVRSELGWHLAYLVNWRLAIDPADLFPASHFWSLAVEEQFYLLWPSLILWLSPSRRVPTLLAACALAVATRALLFSLDAAPYTIRFNTLACLDTLGLGALLATWWRRGDAGRAPLRRVARLGLAVGLPGVALALASVRGLDDRRYWAFSSVFTALAGAWLVLRSARRTQDLLGRTLESAPLRALGRVSYALYLFHMPVLWALPFALRALGWQPGMTGRQALLFVTTFALAALSWQLVESRLLRMKRYFPM